MWYTFVVHTKIVWGDFENDSYAQNSEVIQTIRIQENLWYSITQMWDSIPHMYYTIPHLWYTKTNKI